MSLDLYLCYGYCPHCKNPGGEVWSRNITHNVQPMWTMAGVHEALYESEGREAKEFIEVMERGVADMEANFAEYEKLDSPNGWGLAKHALPWLEGALRAFRQFPDARIHVSR